MVVFNWNKIKRFVAGEEAAPSIFTKGAALTIGSFDGPHKGHDALFDLTLKTAAMNNLISGVVTFSNPVGRIKSSDIYGGDVSTLSQRMEYCDKKGIETVIVIDFSDEFCKINGYTFLSILKTFCGMKFLIEGCDFHCGYRGSVNIDDIKVYACKSDFQVKIVPPVLYDGERISSSRIRQDIIAGKFEIVKEMLGHPFCFDCGEYTWNFQQTMENNVILSMKRDFTQVLPAGGVYNVLVILSGGYAGENYRTEKYTYKAKLLAKPQIISLVISSEIANMNIKAIEFISMADVSAIL